MTTRNYIRVHKPDRDNIPFMARTYVPMWLVDVLALPIDFYTVAGFPTWKEAMNYANKIASE